MKISYFFEVIDILEKNNFSLETRNINVSTHVWKQTFTFPKLSINPYRYHVIFSKLKRIKEDSSKKSNHNTIVVLSNSNPYHPKKLVF